MAGRRPNGDGTIRKREDGRWEGRITIGKRKDGSCIVKTVTAKTQKALLQKFNEMKFRYAGANLVEKCQMTVGEWLIDWLENYKKHMIRPTTYRGYKNYIEKHMIPYIGKKPITNLRTADIQKMYNKLKECGRTTEHPEDGYTLSNSMVRSVHMLLHEALDGAVKERIIPSNPTKGVVLPKIDYKDKRILLEYEVDRLLEVSKERDGWYDFFYLECMTGLRKGEICALKWSDYDEINRKLSVKRTATYMDGKLTIGETKTERSRRKIILPKSVAKMLSERKKSAVSEWIYPSVSDITKPLNPQTAYYTLKKFLKEADIPTVRFHDLRHTFATHAASSGVDPKTLSAILGHTDASFTLDTYTHVTTDMQRNASKVVNNFMTDLFGKDLKIWEKEKTEKEQ